MNAPGKTMLKVVSIIYIIFGAFFALFAILALLIGPVIASFLGGMLGAIGGMLGGAIGGLIGIILLIPTAIYLVIGIIGVKKCAVPTAALFFIIVGFIFGAFALIPLFSSADFLSVIFNLIGLALPVLYIVGGFMNKNAVPKA